VSRELEKRRRQMHIASEIVRRSKMVVVDPITDAWEATAAGQTGHGAASLMEFLVARHPSTVHRIMQVLEDPED
jgi:hypothetical protein